MLLLSISLAGFGQKRTPKTFFDYNNVEIKNLRKHNTPYSDMGPTFVRNSLWFSSFLDQNSRMKVRKVKRNMFFLREARIDTDGIVLQEEKPEIKLPLYDTRYHAGPGSYCEATKELFMTVSNTDEYLTDNRVVVKTASIKLKIDIWKEENGKWVRTGDFPYHHPGYSYGHPSISSTGDTLFFSSNDTQYGNNGGIDIYMSIRKNGQWQKPVPLGTQINSAGDDMFPHFFRGHTLFYASSGKAQGKTDLDIYMSKLENGKFTEPVAIDVLNSDKDDYGLIIAPSEKVGYLSSARDGGEGEDDIYAILLEKIEIITKLKLHVVDSETQQALNEVHVVYNDLPKEYTNEGGEHIRQFDPEVGYSVSLEKEGYYPFCTNLHAEDLEKQGDSIYYVAIDMTKLEVGKSVELKNINYDYDDWKILPESEIELDRLVKYLSENTNVKVELASHTDSRGSDKYNMRLSQKRSDAAVQYIISKGINSSRIIAKGYGESRLKNRCTDGVECSEAEHRENRRTEFTILEYMD